MANTKVITGKVRFSYVNIFEPMKNEDGTDGKYGITLLIPKSDTDTLNKIKSAMADAREVFCNKNGATALPQKPNHTLHDGDGLKDSGEPYSEECKGCYVMNVSSKVKPLMLDSFRNEIADPNEIYSGCYGRASINFYGYNTAGKKGVSAGLLSIQKLSDGEPLGSARVTAADDFGDDEDDWMS